MGRKVLVLNADYTALSICTVPKAFLLVYLQKAELVSENEKFRLRSVNASYPLPSIIKLNKYINKPYKGVVLNRQNIFKRDGNKCAYCGYHKDLTLDHVLPKSRGGKTNWDNLITACKKCNGKKGDFTPEEAKMPLFTKPHKPNLTTFLSYLAEFSDRSWSQYLGKRAQ